MKTKSEIISTTGEIGDMYFWFPDSWHGRNLNLSDSQTCILMGDFENKGTDRKSVYVYTINLHKKKIFLIKFFQTLEINLII